MDKNTKKKKPSKWTDVYPQGTKAGDEEQSFFVALARHPKFAWRSVAALSKESGLTLERVEELLQKYHRKGMVFQNPATEDQWGYWERVPQQLPDETKSVAQEDQQKRIDRSKP